jgi:hypothetical protein
MEDQAHEERISLEKVLQLVLHKRYKKVKSLIDI